ncbi:MAG: hypothetical protein EAY75_04110 [Bacteroidetes bacterium]|nr:MAG: hypothetical protein EAY75_04110 [Bacteroidota bacterium]
MDVLFRILLVLHVACGCTGLLSGTISAIAAKGGKLHKGSGKVFFYSMVATGITAIMISFLPGHQSLFLFAVGGFTLYMVLSGYRIVWLNRHRGALKRPALPLDWALAAFGLLFSLFLIAMAATRAAETRQMFALVPAVFGLICLMFSRADWRVLNGNVALQSIWLKHHLGRMIGALVASYTAFLVVNVHIEQSWILWLLPTAVGGLCIARFRRQRLLIPTNLTVQMDHLP